MIMSIKIIRLIFIVVSFITISVSLLTSSKTFAHEIPNDVLIQSYLKPEAQRMNLLLRAPIEAMRDINFPVIGPGYIKIHESEEFLRDAAEIWLANFIQIYEDGDLLEQWTIDAVRISLPSDRSFVDYDSAHKLVTGPPMPDDTELFFNQALLDVKISYPITSRFSEFSVDPNFNGLGLRTTTVMNFIPEEGVRRVFRFSDNPGIVRLDPRWHHAFTRFIDSGIQHILNGTDHLLFVFCLILPFRKIRPLIIIVTSFTVAHSITLIASAFGMAPKSLWFPPLIEMLIAASIVYMAIENLFNSRWERRWLTAFFFGLFHGFGFSFALSETLQFAGSHLITSLLAFNLGVEIGQLLLIILSVPLINFVVRNERYKRPFIFVVSVIIAHTAWHWMGERFSVLNAYQFDISTIIALEGDAGMKWIIFLLITSIIFWCLHRIYERFITYNK